MRGGRRRDHRRACGATRPGRAASATSSAGSSSTACRPPTTKRPPRRASPCTTLLTELAAAQAVGEHGLVALDWHSGNRSVLVDHELSGVVVGQTLATRPEDTYRALLEATAFGTRRIIEAFRDSGVPVTELVVAGGLLSQRAAHADLRRRHQRAAVDDRLRAGARARRGDPRRRRGGRLPRHPRRRRRPWARGTAASTSRIRSAPRRYDELYAEYLTLHDYFGRGANDVMHRLKARRRAGRRRRGPDDADRGRRTVSRVRETVAAPARRAHPQRAGRLDRGQRLGPGARPRPHGDQAVRGVLRRAHRRRHGGLDLHGTVVDGEHAPSSDTAAHAYVYRHMPQVGGVVHTHSTYATAWAARGEPIPCVLTMIADEFGGEVPVGPFALIGDDSIGRGIVETLRRHRSRAVLMRNHGAVHDRPRRPRRGQGRRDARGRRPHRAHRPPARHPASLHRPADVDALFTRYQNVYGQERT